MRGLEEGKGKLLRRENNNHMLIMFLLQICRKYSSQLRMCEPKAAATLSCWRGGLFWGFGISISLSQ